MNVLITGGAGFIGSNFVRYWRGRYPKDRVIVYDKLTYAGNFESIKDLVVDKNCIFIKADILDKKEFGKALDTHAIDLVVHFAAETHVDRSIEGPEIFFQTNALGTLRILDEIRQRPHIRLHHVSTDEVFGSLPLDRKDLKFTEETRYDPQSPYSASKAASDHLVRAYVNTYKIQATISNCSNNFGPYCYPEKLIPVTITRALNDEEIPIYGDGLHTRDWIYVEDHCRGIDMIIQKGKIGETYILGGDGEHTNIDMMKQVLKIMSKPESLIVHVEDRKGHDRRYAMDYSKARAELGYTPGKNTFARLEETVKWYVEHEDWWKPLKQNADKIVRKFLNNKT